MKKQVSPAIAIVIILVCLALGGLYYYRFMQFTMHAPGPIPGRKQPPPPKGMIEAFAKKQSLQKSPAKSAQTGAASGKSAALKGKSPSLKDEKETPKQ